MHVSWARNNKLGLSVTLAAIQYGQDQKLSSLTLPEVRPRLDVCILDRNPPVRPIRTLNVYVLGPENLLGPSGYFCTGMKTHYLGRIVH